MQLGELLTAPGRGEKRAVRAPRARVFNVKLTLNIIVVFTIADLFS